MVSAARPKAPPTHTPARRGVNEILTFDFSARSYVVRTQGLDSEVTGESEASMQDEGLAAPECTLAKGRCTAAPSKRPQDSAQTVSQTDFTINRVRSLASPRERVRPFSVLRPLTSSRGPLERQLSATTQAVITRRVKLLRQRAARAANSRYPQQRGDYDVPSNSHSQSPRHRAESRTRTTLSICTADEIRLRTGIVFVIIVSSTENSIGGGGFEPNRSSGDLSIFVTARRAVQDTYYGFTRSRGHMKMSLLRFFFLAFLLLK